MNPVGAGLWSGGSYSGIPEHLRDLRAVGSRLHSLLLDDSVPQISGNSWVHLNSAGPESDHGNVASLHEHESLTTVPTEKRVKSELAAEAPSAKMTAPPTLRLPFTDSGYESAPAFSYPVPKTSGKSLYTEDSITDGRSAQRYSEELANDIYRTLQLEEKRDEWKAISASAPKLLRAFAIKIGCHSEDPSMRSVMKFVHRHCRDILASIDSLLEPEEGGNNPGGPANENMSLLDKMTLWALKESSEAAHCGDPGSAVELFEGVPGEEDDLGFLGVSNYRALIVDSPPYQWLISALRHEMLLSALRGPDVKHTGLKDEILDKLPPGLLSRRAAPMLYQMTFEVPWNPVRTPCRSWLSDNSCTMFVGDLQSCVAESASDFVQRRWPLNKGRLLPMMQRLASSGTEPGFIISDDLDEDTTGTVWIEDGKLRLAVTGPAYSVAENGEQLAWLACGFLPSPSQRIAHGAPFIRALAVSSEAKSSQAGSHAPTTQNQGFCAIDFKFEETQSARNAISEEWHSLLRRRVVVHWPSPSSLSGLDAPFGRLCALIGDGFVELANNCILLRGSGGLLTLEGYRDNRYVWKVLYDASMTFHQGRMDESNPLWEQAKTKRFADSRHLVWSNNNIGLSQDSCNLHHDNFAARGVKSDGTASVDQGAPHASLVSLPAQKNPSSPEGSAQLRTQFAAPVTKPSRPPAAPNDLTAIQTEQHYVPEGPSPTDAAVSSGESVDSDMLSISDRSYRIDSFGLDPVAADALNEVLHRLIEEWLEIHRACPQSSETYGSSSTCVNVRSQTHRSASRADHSRASGSPRKRQKTSTDPEDNDDDGEDNPPKPPFLRAGNHQFETKSFACPYWKRSPRKHRDCFNRKLMRVKDVKLHLWRKHSISPLSCPRCFDIFDTEETRHEHVFGDAGCIARPERAADLMSPSQAERLRRRSKPGQDVARQWFAIWQILFPDVPHPRSPYMDFERSREFCEWEDFCRERGTAMLSEVIERLLRQGNPSAEIIATLPNIIQTGFRSVFQEFQLDSSEDSVSNLAPQLSLQDGDTETVQLEAVSEGSSEPPDFSADGSSADSSSPIAPRRQLVEPAFSSMENSLAGAGGYSFASTEMFEPAHDPLALVSSGDSMQWDGPDIRTTGFRSEDFHLNGISLGNLEADFDGFYLCNPRLLQNDEDAGNSNY
ncbi:hypothetical protein QBC34DRAFT_143042 [Podospora aff. communis PSN243]|uniref:Uncharacterized protein n=1 Tax=Podospora aff. communis PSN243 TaxID=3040156 RepID=A0AAV9GI94_9PEZI|nr:hypothetical protein QBC34DRAFT_143042 [Podospora aff. communis PSN243]